ncbi:hypothetical protein K458DRAFT_479113 [Lentithecium fluviatile CBS 122367]|uniref:NB-ARC domain-containing protein n=1 Tax=Lentithecium fluviatile CBS 122367 TaxID=1168545 RepID=A0A6G1IUF3_9PLEO|nr:hypothetical protein K458DRAFT_479113 [Lentithecium fluviatile CBS 122367]
MASSPKQLGCADYHVAWISPLFDVELIPARLMLDEKHATPRYDTHHDENTYTCGEINGHTVVIATCPPSETTNVNTARLTGSMFKTFRNLGWSCCGQTPACVYYDRGKVKVGGKHEILTRLQKRKDLASTFARPSLEHDRLFKPTYHHIGKYGSGCVEPPACDQNELVQRRPRSADPRPNVIFHLGRIAIVNTVIQNGELRDKISTSCDGALCIETEAAGVDVNRRCLVIRGISDYADSHKNDIWKSYAAGNTAAFTRELLCKIQPAEVKEMEPVATECCSFRETPSFAGREAQLAQLQAHVSSEGGRRLAIYGLGGCGKTALVLELAYRTREQQPARAVFWVPAISRTTFEQAYRDIATALHIPGIGEVGADIKQLVKSWLSDEKFGQWLIILDNADDKDVLYETESSGDKLIDFLPQGRKGSVVFTTRTRQVAVDLSILPIELGKLKEEEAEEVLRKRLHKQRLLEDDQVVATFIKMLSSLALAIVQALAYINKNDCTLEEYMSAYRGSDKVAIALLSKEFKDIGRYRETKNPVATTWYISFQQIQKHNPLAADYLSFMACTTGESVPRSLLPPGSSKQTMIEAFGTLTAYAFITKRQEEHGGGEPQQQEMFDMHRLVRLAMQNWLRQHQQWDDWTKKALVRLLEVVPLGGHEKKEVWTAYLPHATYIVDFPELYKADGRIWLFDRIGGCEHSLGRTQKKSAEAEKMCQETLGLSEVVLGKEHPQTLRSARKYAEAEKMHRETLKLQEKVFGKEDTSTLELMAILVQILYEQGKYAEAAKINQKTMVLMKKVLGEAHPSTLMAMSDMAWILGGQKKFAEAENICRKTLTRMEKVGGRKHPSSLMIKYNLASALHNQGKHAEAEKMHRESLALREEVLGKKHPDTLDSISSLADTLCQQEQYEEALSLYERAYIHLYGLEPLDSESSDGKSQDNEFPHSKSPESKSYSDRSTQNSAQGYAMPSPPQQQSHPGVVGHIRTPKRRKLLSKDSVPNEGFHRSQQDQEMASA